MSSLDAVLAQYEKSKQASGGSQSKMSQDERMKKYFALILEDKEKEMELTGKKEYVLTPDEVTDINASEIKGTFQPSKTDDNQNYSSR